jgi:hypothetical protein
MDLIDRYLNAVAAQLPQDERNDITAELRDLILSRFEAKEEALGRALTEDEQEEILREIGHPLVVAARYRKGPDSLVGPELFPYWLFGVKAGLMVLGVVFALTLFIRLIGGSDNFGQDIAHAFHGVFGAGLTLIGIPSMKDRETHYGVHVPWIMGLIATRTIDKPVEGIFELVATAEDRIESGVIAYDALEKVKANPADPVARGVFETHRRDLGYGLLLKRHVADPRMA